MSSLALRLRFVTEKTEATRCRQGFLAKAFLSLERSCSSLNSFCAANVDASSTDHAAAGDQRASEGRHVLGLSCVCHAPIALYSWVLDGWIHSSDG